MDKEIKELEIISTKSDGISLNTEYFGKKHPYISYRVSYGNKIVNKIIDRHYGLVYSSTLEGLLSNLGWGLQYTPYLNSNGKYIIKEKSTVSSLIGLSIPSSINDDTSIEVLKDEKISFDKIMNIQNKLNEFFSKTYDIDYSIPGTVDIIRSGESTYSSYLNLNDYLKDDSSEYMITVGLSYSKENNKKLYYTSFDNSIININSDYQELVISNNYSDNLGGIITFKEDITEIPDNLFEDFGNLESIIIPDSVYNIGDNDFSKCVVTFRPIIVPDINCSLSKIYVPRTSKELYEDSLKNITIVDYQRTYNKRELKLISRNNRDCIQHPIDNDILVEFLNKKLRIFIESKDVVECILDYCYIDKM